MYSCYYILTLMATLAGTNMRIGESFIPGGVTHTLGRNDRGVTPTGESFINPLTTGKNSFTTKADCLKFH